MFRYALIAAIVGSEIVAHNAEVARLTEVEKTMSPEAFKAYMEKYEDSRTAARAAAAEERRHREHCEAIRSTSFWRFGS
jgi:hypothetical protein